jgi:hypothetical protein
MKANSLREMGYARGTAGFMNWRILGVGATIAVIGGFFMPAYAEALTTISQGYATTEKLPLGTLVSLQKNSSDQVIPASTSNVDNLLGVVINDENSLLSVNNGLPSQVQVATSGTVQVLVTDINGDIKRGDHITASPIAGVGMKATANVRVMGIAEGDLAKDANKQTYKDKNGKEHTAVIGDVPVLVTVAYYFKEPEKTVIPSAIQNVANALAGRSVGTLPILVSGAIFIVMIIVVVSIIYSMIHSSIISVGRNPLSQSAVYRNLIQLSALVLAIMGVGLGAIYMVLTRL